MLSEDGSVMACALDSTDIAAEIERIHMPSAVVTAALGRLATAASMIGFSLKGKDDTVTIRIDGGGPAGRLIAVADSCGNVKACADQPIVEIPLNAAGKLDVKGAVGTDGYLSVIKDFGLKEPYIGQTPAGFRRNSRRYYQLLRGKRANSHCLRTGRLSQSRSHGSRRRPAS